MTEPMDIIEMLITDSGEDCRRGMKDKMKKKRHPYACFFAIALVIVLCAVVSVLHEKNIDSDFRPFLENVIKCSYVNQYPLSDEVCTLICVNDISILPVPLILCYPLHDRKAVNVTGSKPGFLFLNNQKSICQP